MNYSPDYDSYFGRPQSDAAADEYARQQRLQDALAVLAGILDAEELTESLHIGIDYSAVRAAIDDATVSATKISDLIDDAENDAWLSAEHDKAEARFDRLRDEGIW